MNTGYFKRMQEISSNQLWINNPTTEEAMLAIEAGAVGCTTNPTHAWKQFTHRKSSLKVKKLIRGGLGRGLSPAMTVDYVQLELVKELCDQFTPLHKKNPAQWGFVSIQGNPFLDDSVDNIVSEALRYREERRNIIAKIPVTSAGLEAMEVLLKKNIPILATEVMTLSQADAANRVYQKIKEKTGRKIPFFITHITGIFDQYLQNYVVDHRIDIQQDILWSAGCLLARKQYVYLKKNGFDGIMMGGGVRDLYHLTEMIGSEMHITANWKGTAETLIKEDPPLVYRMETPIPSFMVDELSNKLPDFKIAWDEKAMSHEQFENFGPVQLFRSMFCHGWEQMVKAVKNEESYHKENS